MYGATSAYHSLELMETQSLKSFRDKLCIFAWKKMKVKSLEQILYIIFMACNPITLANEKPYTHNGYFMVLRNAELACVALPSQNNKWQNNYTIT